MKPQIFATFDDYAAALQHASFRVTALGPTRSAWLVSYLQLDRLTVQWGQDGGPIVFEGALDEPGVLLFTGRDNAHKLIGNGVMFDEDTLMIMPGQAEFCTVSLDTSAWISAFIPLDAIGNASAIGSACRVITPATADSRRVRSALLRIVNTAEGGAFESHPMARTAAASELLQCVRALLGSPTCDDVAHPHGRPAIPRDEILRRARQLLVESDGGAITLEDLASVAEVSERTLHNAFHEQFGVSPKRYLRLHTLNRARSALRSADARVTRVTDVATKLGIWEWGRFSHDYQTLFGELPSQTLRGDHRVNQNWIAPKMPM